MGVHDLPGQAVVGDEDRHPRQRDGQHQQPDRHPRVLVAGRRGDHERDPHRHHDLVAGLAVGELLLVGHRGVGDQHRIRTPFLSHLPIVPLGGAECAMAVRPRARRRGRAARTLADGLGGDDVEQSRGERARHAVAHQPPGPVRGDHAVRAQQPQRVRDGAVGHPDREREIGDAQVARVVQREQDRQPVRVAERVEHGGGARTAAGRRGPRSRRTPGPGRRSARPGATWAPGARVLSSPWPLSPPPSPPA